VPLTHFGAAGSVHCASAVQPVGPPVAGLHTPFSQVKPSSHGFDSQLARHCPSAQTLSSPHSLEYLQVSSGAVQAPATQMSPPEQSAVVSHGQGPALPPHASHLPALQVLPSPQSAFVVHSFTGPGSVPGGEQRLFWHVSPFGQFASSWQESVQPVAVQTSPGLQLVFPVHVAWAGARTGEHP